MTVVCPCCNRPMEAARAPIEGLTSAALGPVARRIVEELVKAYPGSITNAKLVDRVYGEEKDGGPEMARDVIAITIMNLRKKLEALGWTIPHAKSGPGTLGYHLEPIS